MNNGTNKSLSELLSDMAVGERRYIEVLADDLHVVQRRATSTKRLAAYVRSRKFSTRLLTAVGSEIGKVTILTCVERIK